MTAMQDLFALVSWFFTVSSSMSSFPHSILGKISTVKLKGNRTPTESKCVNYYFCSDIACPYFSYPQYFRHRQLDNNMFHAKFALSSVLQESRASHVVNLSLIILSKISDI